VKVLALLGVYRGGWKGMRKRQGGASMRGGEGNHVSRFLERDPQVAWYKGGWIPLMGKKSFILGEKRFYSD